MPITKKPYSLTTAHPLLSQLTIVLVRPKYPGNIGATARIAWNMGIPNLIIVSDNPPERESMARMATHKAVHLIDTMKVYSTLAEAVAPYSLIVGTTARRGRQRLREKSPREMVETIIPQLPNNSVALLFGQEDSGLTNDDLKHCHLLSAIPTADFSSLNLAQAVAIHCYELYYGIIHLQKDILPAPRLASSFELESMYSYIEESLTHIEFLGEKSHVYWMNNIRQFFAQSKLSSKDSNIIRKICKKFLLHYRR
jgi:tRNA/rRNA methyltransferase